MKVGECDRHSGRRMNVDKDDHMRRRVYYDEDDGGVDGIVVHTYKCVYVFRVCVFVYVPRNYPRENSARLYNWQCKAYRVLKTRIRCSK